MISALLLPLLLATAPAGGGAPAVARAAGDEPAVQLWLNSDRTYLPGERAKVQVRARNDGYLLVLHVDPDGILRVLFPLDPNDDNFVRGGKKYEIRGRGGRESFEADGKSGRGTVYAAVSGTPFRFGQFVLADHWDYRALAPNRFPADPEQDLNELVRRMADASFDYDILSYTVVERVVYASDYSYSRPYYDNYWGCGGWSYYCGSGLSVGLFFGRPYRRFYYDPFYDPFFYDPYYYRPAYIYPVRPWGYRYFGYPVYGYPNYGYPYYGGRYYGHRGGNWARPYTPYRFREVEGVQAGYRPRGFDLRRSVNTVYLPPAVRDRTSEASPARRLSDTRPAAEARPTEPRRVDARPVEPRSTAPERRAAPARGSDAGRRAGASDAPTRTRSDAAPRRAESRTVQPNIEARRSREPDRPSVSVPTSRDRQDLPREVRPLSRSEDAADRSVVERQPEPRRAEPRPDPSPQPSAEARPSGRDGGYSRPEPRAEPRPEPQTRPAPSRAPDRGSFSPPSRSDGGSRSGWSGGGDRGGGGRSEGGGMSGGRRR
jgi:uncharacterized membrane protein YgcG